MNSITLNAPAKINLCLDVINKRSDGYHDIVTIFKKLKLSDTIKISPAKKGITLNCKGFPIPKGSTNLAHKAASLMLREFNLTAGLKIEIDKKIPVAAGLGGGSSDAASVALGVNKLFGLKADIKQLLRISKSIGADVPFFVSGYDCAIGRGIGERLKELKYRFRPYLLLIKPNIRIYTKYIYNKIRLPLTKPPVGVTMLAHILSDENRDKAKAPSLYNRLEEIVFALHPVTKRIKDRLSLYTNTTLLSGSGPTIFGLFDERKEAIKAAADISKHNKWQILITRTS